MMRFFSKLLIIAILPFFLLAFSWGSNKPKESELKNALAQQIPGFVKVASFKIEALQNYGTEVEPRYRSRFKATIEAADNLYKVENKENDVLFVRLQTSKGKRADIFGKTTSILYQGTWQHSIEIDGNPISNLGGPLNLLSGGRVIVRGSKEEAAYLSEVRAERDRRRALLSLATTPTREIGRCRTKTEGQPGELYVSDVGFRATTPWPLIKPDVSFASVKEIHQGEWGGMPTVVFVLTEKIPNSAAPGADWTAFFFDRGERDRCYEIAVQAHSAWKVKFQELVGVGHRGLQSP